MTAWDEYLHGERQWLADRVKLIAPPTRTNTIHATWAMVRECWNERSIDGRLVVLHDLAIIEPIQFELIRYGGETVIEAEGVIVERL